MFRYGRHVSERIESTSRRRFVVAGAATAAAAAVQAPLRRSAVAATASACVLTPEQEEGPFYIPGEHVRSAIAEGHAGIPLTLRIVAVDRACTPIAGATVDIWQCDAMGVYSGYAANPGGPPPGGPPRGAPPPGEGPLGEGPPGGAPPGGGPPPDGGRMKPRPTNDKTFLRGIQTTDAAGLVAFSTIFPGFYEGRVNHVHLKVRHSGKLHTGQIFFPEPLARALSEREPYAQHHIERTTLERDHVYVGQSGSSAMSRVRRDDESSAEAYVAEITVTVAA